MASPVPARPIEPDCTLDDHDVLKVDEETFLAGTTHHAYMPDGDGGWLELRHCRRCGSTLSRDAAVEVKS